MNTKVKIVMWEHKCERCGHKWTTPKELPKNCRGCNSPYWYKKRVR